MKRKPDFTRSVTAKFTCFRFGCHSGRMWACYPPTISPVILELSVFTSPAANSWHTKGTHIANSNVNMLRP